MTERPHPRLGALVVGRFLFGQGMVVIANVVVGLMIVRVLPLTEYALYISVSLLLTLISVGSDLGLSQGVNSLGARIHNAPVLLGTLVTAALRYRRIFFVVAALCVVGIGYFMFRDGQWSTIRVGFIIVIVLVIGWIQSPVSIKKSILNVNHDAKALFHVGISESLARMATVWICLLSPTAESALFTNLVGFVAARIVVTKHCRYLLIDATAESAEYNRQLLDFVIPLLPAVIYFLFQGQLAIFLLNIYGYTESVAEVGALGRLGQIVGLLMMLNPFLIQPFFARMNERGEFVFWARVVVAVLIFISVAVIATGYFLPSLWLFILGGKYSGLAAELPLALAGAMASLFGATVYTLVVSRKNTKGQTWTVVGGLSIQMLFLATRGIHSTSDALILNLLPYLTYLFIQLLILTRVVLTWPTKKLCAQ